MEDRLRRTVLIVALLNLGYFGIEFAVALAIGSVSLFADSVDFLEDASINLLIFAALGWSLAMRSCVGMLMATIILIPSLATLWTAWEKFNLPVPPDPVPLSLAGAGAFAVDLTCALIYPIPRASRQPHPRGLPLGPQRRSGKYRLVATGLATAFVWRSAWPDVIIRLGIAAMNADAAREVRAAAREEHRAVRA